MSFFLCAPGLLTRPVFFYLSVVFSAACVQLTEDYGVWEADR